MIKLKDIIAEITANEGVNDPGVLKAVFLAGGPGSGKSTVAKDIFGFAPKMAFSAQGLKTVNSDRFFEFLLKKGGFSSDLASLTPDEFKRITLDPNSPRIRGKEMYKTAYGLYLGGRLGMLIDGTGDDTDKLIKQAETLQKDFGYDVTMVFVNTPLQKALDRNNNRARKLPRDIVTTSWKEAQEAKSKYQAYFGDSFVEVMNDKDRAPGEALDISPEVHKHARKFMSAPLQNPVGKQWMKDAQAAKLQEADASDYKIFCDMDGVLADFVKQWVKYYKHDPKIQKKKWGKKEFDYILDGAPYEFWYEMPWMPNAKGGEALWNKIKKYDTQILSAPAESEGSRKGKADWLKSKGITVKLNLKKSSEKHEFAAPNHILIDDYKRNIEQWRAAGGIGIHHTDNATTFAELKKYGII